jgi:hypothetical protein
MVEELGIGIGLHRGRRVAGHDRTKIAELLMAAEEYLKLGERPVATVTIQEIEEARSRWSTRKSLPPIRLHPRVSRQRFVCIAARWLTFLNRLQVPSKPVKVYDQMIIEFTDFMQKERGLARRTIEQRCSAVREFLDRLCERERSLSTITVAYVDSVHAQKVNEQHYARVTVSVPVFGESRPYSPVVFAGQGRTGRLVE